MILRQALRLHYTPHHVHRWIYPCFSIDQLSQYMHQCKPHVSLLPVPEVKVSCRFGQCRQ
ncbi:hypothetical protein HMI54_011448 [Coelomomyces lativittatus]|nr:hypothetical protein HMI54_011448 [Coelomomyces lativittatus]KAJ1515239.1 hypothetical protein HMI55_003902 [Coelomomyces lativittatus]